MALKLFKLTDRMVRKMKQRGYFGDGGGLWLQVSKSSSKSWVFIAATWEEIDLREAVWIIPKNADEGEARTPGSAIRPRNRTSEAD